MRTVFNAIRLDNIRGDLFGGVTAAVVALPMALAFGVASGAGAEAGLYGAILVGLFASLFGGSPTLISEPTGPMTVVFTAVIANLMASHPDQGMAMAFTVVIMAGVFQILFGLMRLGKYVTLMPYTVVSGFMSGIGVILIILQLGPLLGQPNPSGGTLAILQQLPDLVDGFKPQELALGVLTMVILFFFPVRMKRFLPPQLVALVVGTVISVLWLDMEAIRRIGEIPTGLPAFQLPVFSADQWQTMVVDALVLGLLGCIDALLTSVIADSLTGGQHDSDKELVGQGMGNIASGLFGGLPGAGATMGTVVNIQAGATSALSGLVRAAILIVVVLWATGLTAVIPLVVLAGIAFKVGFDIVDWPFLRRVHQASLKGALITYGVIALTVFVDLIAAVGIGLFVANVFTISRLAEAQSDHVKAICAGEGDLSMLSEAERALLEQIGNRLMLLSLGGQMNFAASRAINRKAADCSSCDALVIDLSGVHHLGVSAALALQGVIQDMTGAQKPVYLVADEGQSLERLRALGIVSQVRDEHVLPTRIAALQLAMDELDAKV